MLCVCILFFVKQKTAYEMRISDWSSDVCSSNLAVVAAILHLQKGAGMFGEGARHMGGGLADRHDVGDVDFLRRALLMRHPSESWDPRPNAVPYRDRKSVVSGKSVSVRVHPGGRSNLKKKTNLQ